MLMGGLAVRMGSLAVLMGSLAVRMGGLARKIPGRGTNLFPFGWICNPAVMIIRICNPDFALFIALQMLILKTVGLQIRPNGL